MTTVNFQIARTNYDEAVGAARVTLLALTAALRAVAEAEAAVAAAWDALEALQA